MSLWFVFFSFNKWFSNSPNGVLLLGRCALTNCGAKHLQFIFASMFSINHISGVSSSSSTFFWLSFFFSRSFDYNRKSVVSMHVYGLWDPHRTVCTINNDVESTSSSFDSPLLYACYRIIFLYTVFYATHKHQSIGVHVVDESRLRIFPHSHFQLPRRSPA